MNPRTPSDLQFSCDVPGAIERLGGDVQLYQELVQCFLDDSSGLLPAVQRAIQQRDANALHRAAHSLKGLAASCGATMVVNAAARLEQFGREHELDLIDDAWHPLEAAFNATRTALAAYYSREAPR